MYLLIYLAPWAWGDMLCHYHCTLYIIWQFTFVMFFIWFSANNLFSLQWSVSSVQLVSDLLNAVLKRELQVLLNPLLWIKNYIFKHILWNLLLKLCKFAFVQKDYGLAWKTSSLIGWLMLTGEAPLNYNITRQVISRGEPQSKYITQYC